MTRFQDMLCGDDTRRATLRTTAGLYGIDFLEVRTSPPIDNQRVLELHFQGKAADPGFNNFLNQLDGAPERFPITGGVRVQGVRVDSATRSGDIIVLHTTMAGDFSDYRLRVDHPQMDPVFAEVEFNFKAGCPSKFDCKPARLCEPPVLESPAIDYNAKDYASFRQALLDRIALTMPEWKERRIADLGIALAELFAYTGDRLSYYQDAVSNEAYLETANQRISVRRHTRLIDYSMHDGASSRAFVVFEVATKGQVPQGTQILTKLLAPLKGQVAPKVIPVADKDDALALANVVFELERAISADPGLTGMPIYEWGRQSCCLPKGATTADLLGDRQLKPGDLLLIEEVKSSVTGLPQDGDPEQRQIVRLTKIIHLTDPLDNTALTRVEWDPADALLRPICLSAVLPNGTLVTGIASASGNVGIVHHGKRIHTTITSAANLVLEESPVSHWQALAPDAPVAELRKADPRQARPVVAIENWTRRDTLLDSDPADAHFVVEIDNQGRASLRFGDGVAGKQVALPLEVTYHTGLGSAFDVPSESLVHILDPGALPDVAVLLSVRNPLPAWGGTAPEPIEDVRLTAPASLRTGLYRAVTEADYVRAAETMPEVSKAVATFRWTGSWHTVFITVDPAGGAELTDSLRQAVDRWVRRFLQTGYDLEINSPVYVPLDIEIIVCTDPEHFRSDVYQILLRELGSGTSAGRQGFFHPDRFTFGQPLFLSRLYAVITNVEGVRSAKVTKLQRFGKAAQGELSAGVLRMGATEVVRCDNDLNFAERGVLKIQMEGGK
jgi:hypothetical protein